MPLTVEKILFQPFYVRGRMTLVLLLRHQTQADLQPREEPLKSDVQVAESEFRRFEMIAGQDPKPQPLPGRPVRIRKTVQRYSAMGGGSHDPTKATTSTKPTSEKNVPPPGRRSSICDLGVS